MATDHRPEWDMARLAPLSERAVNHLWNRHAHQRLSAHRLQELLSDLVDLLYDPSMSDGEHPAAAARLPDGGPGLGLVEAGYVTEHGAMTAKAWARVDEARVAHLRTAHDEPF